ncbi:hypothetical protein BC940DRAFT_305551 [Gongronella butleri]|nr:hypothetical protein BC940DRAFT_305551 [Gongronella butleri]
MACLLPLLFFFLLAMSTTTAHLLPFKVFKEEKVDTDKFLSITHDNQARSTVIAGRILEGIELTPSVPGYIWKQSINYDAMDDAYDSENEEENTQTPAKEWTRTDTKIEKLIVWNKDTAPAANNPQALALEHWVKMADVIHGEIPL